MTNYRKSIAAAVGAILTILSATGVVDVVNPEVQTAIVTLLTVAAVYLLPNNKSFPAFRTDNAVDKEAQVAAFLQNKKDYEGTE